MSIVLLTNHSNIDPNKFCSHLTKTSTSSRTLILVELSLQFMENNFQKYYSNFTCLNLLSTKWKPVILVTIRDAANWSTTRQQDLLQKIFDIDNPSISLTLSLNSLIFFNFMDTQIPNLWEVYKIKEVLIVSQLHKHFNNLALPSSGPLQQDISLHTEAYVRRRSNFHNQKFTATVKASANDDWAFVENSESSDGKNTLILTGGYVAFLYHDLRKLLNYSQNIILGDSPKVINGTLSGTTVTQLNSDEADVTLTLMSATEERLSSLTFLIPTHTSV